MISGYHLRCGKCRYDLTGLGAQGSCPECGQFFDSDTGQGLARDDAQDQVDWWLRRLRTVFVCGLAVMFLMCAGLGAAFKSGRLAWTSVFFAGVAVLGAFTSYKYEKSD